MLHKPDNFLLFDAARVIVASDDDKPTKVFFSKADVLSHLDDVPSRFYDFFDHNGDNIGSVEIKDQKHGHSEVFFEVQI